MLVSTTPTIEGRRVVKYLGLVSGETVMGANVIKDLIAGIGNIVGGRVGVYENELKKGKTAAIDVMTEEARNLGANAIVGVDLDYETVGESMLMITASGTAVVVELTTMKKVYVSLDYDNDKGHKFVLETWYDANLEFAFVFDDFTLRNREINSTNVSRIKNALTNKINSATYTLVIIGKQANNLHKYHELIGFKNWMNFEVHQSKTES